MISFIIKTFPQVFSHPFSVEDETKVSQLKVKIQNQLDIEIPAQCLIYRGRILDDVTALADLDLQGKVIELFVNQALRNRPPHTSMISSEGIDDSTSESSEDSTTIGGSIVRSESPITDRMNNINLLKNDILDSTVALRHIMNPTEGGSIVMTELTAMDRITNIKNFIYDIRDSLGALRSVINLTEVQPGPEEVGSIARDLQTSDCSVRMAEGCNSLPQNYAQVVNDLAQVKLEFEPYLSRYGDLLNAISAGDGLRYTPEQEEKVKEMVDLIGTVWHKIAHAYLASIEIHFAVENNDVSFLSQDQESPFPSSSNGMTESIVIDRTNKISRCIHEIKDSLSSLRAIMKATEANSGAPLESPTSVPIPAEQEANFGAPLESPTSVLKIPAEQEVQPGPEEVGSIARDLQTSDCSFAQAIDDLAQLQLEFAPYLSCYGDLLRAVSASDVEHYTPEQKRKVKGMIDLIGTVCYKISHACFAINKIDFPVDNNEVSRLSQDHRILFQGGSTVITESTAIDDMHNIDRLILDIRHSLVSLRDMTDANEVYSNLIPTLAKVNPGTTNVYRPDNEQRLSDTEHKSSGNVTSKNTFDIVTYPLSRKDLDDLMSAYSFSDEDMTLLC